MTETRTIRVVVFRDDELYIAQGLEVDICAQGKTPEEASKRFAIALNAESQEANEHGQDLFDAIDPAPAVFFAMYESNEVTRQTKDLPAAA